MTAQRNPTRTRAATTATHVSLKYMVTSSRRSDLTSRSIRTRPAGGQHCLRKPPRSDATLPGTPFRAEVEVYALRPRPLATWARGGGGGMASNDKGMEPMSRCLRR